MAYDGTAYSGWQLQPNVPTVQGTIERVIGQITQRPARLRPAGRTDAGVHAEGQVASFFTESPLSCRRLLHGLNALLPPDIVIHALDEVSPAFDARRDNAGKHYRYTIYNGRLRPPQLIHRAHQVHRPLCLPAMARAARALVGTRDFSAFRAADCERETTVRTIYRCTIARDGPIVAIDVEGTAFLKNMVRIIAGTLLDIGCGRLEPTVIGRLLADGDRTQAGMTAPAHGLCLVRVFLR